MADLLGHTISVESSPGKGSSFSVRVPRARSHGGRAPTDEETAAMAHPAAGLVVIVEDDIKVAKAWELLLRAEGYGIAVAESVADARCLAETLRDDVRLIISDYHLADGSNGVNATQVLRDVLGAGIPAFIVTGDTSRIAADVEELENCRIMSKPINPDVLLRLARNAIDAGRA
jgi:DNA-binding NtrC family response regulator